MKKLLIPISFSLLLASCQIFKPNIMLRTPPGYVYDSLPADTVGLEYKIAPNDLLFFRIFTNDGFKLIDITATNNITNRADMRQSMDYLVEFDGLVKFPILGRIKLAGYTLRQAEKMLEEAYGEYYNKPFVILKINNRRVTVFPGGGSTARVIPLENENTSLLEALALAGGIASNGKARKIKLIRGKASDPEVFLIDLSTIYGMKDGGIVLQANDIIYVEPTLQVSRTILAELTPIIGLISSTLVIYSLFITR